MALPCSPARQDDSPLGQRAWPPIPIHAEALQALGDEGVPAFEPTIARREAFKQAAGIWVKVATEIKAMIEQ